MEQKRGRPRARSRRPIKGIAHGLRGYAAGCGCDVCSEAKAESTAAYRERQNGYPQPEEQPDNVTSIRTAKGKRDNGVDGSAARHPAGQSRNEAAPVGDVEKAVIEECQGLSLASERPAMVAQAKGMARILDNPKQVALHPTTTRMLTQILNDLRGNSKKKTRSRLASVQRMTSGEGIAR